jgi:hypothetical protein
MLYQYKPTLISQPDAWGKHPMKEYTEISPAVAEIESSQEQVLRQMQLSR